MHGPHCGCSGLAQALAMSSATRRSHHFSAMSAACSVPMEGKNGSLSLSEATGLAAATFAAGFLPFFIGSLLMPQPLFQDPQASGKMLLLVSECSQPVRCWESFAD